MSFSYHALNEEECKKANQYPLLEPGIYNFQVKEAKYKTSSKGNPMIALKLVVWNDDGREFTVFDYLVGTEKMAWKTKHFCDSVGLHKEYESKQFNEFMCEGKCGIVSIIYQPGDKKPDGTYYPDKNGVEDYVMTHKGALKHDSNSQSDNTFNDEIPF